MNIRSKDGSNTIRHNNTPCQVLRQAQATVYVKLQAQDVVVIEADWVLASHRGESVCKIDRKLRCPKPILLGTEAELKMSIFQDPDNRNKRQENKASNSSECSASRYTTSKRPSTSITV